MKTDYINLNRIFNILFFKDWKESFHNKIKWTCKKEPASLAKLDQRQFWPGTSINYSIMRSPKRIESNRIESNRAELNSTELKVQIALNFKMVSV